MGFIQRDLADLCDDISLLQASQTGRAVPLHLRDVNTPLGWQTIQGRDLRIDRLETNPKIGACKISLFYDLLCYRLSSVHRNGESQPLGDIAAACVADDQRVDTHYFSREIDQRPTGVAVIDRRVRLDQILDLI